MRAWAASDAEEEAERRETLSEIVRPRSLKDSRMLGG